MHFQEAKGSVNIISKGNIVLARAAVKADIGDESVTEDTGHSDAVELGSATTEPTNACQDAGLHQLGDQSSYFGEHTEDGQSG